MYFKLQTLTHHHAAFDLKQLKQDAKNIIKSPIITKQRRSLSPPPEFPSCSVNGASARNPTNVHKLQPADIKIIAAMGDSLTTGFGAESTSLDDLSAEWRGDVFSIGGAGTYETHSTLPNILKKFNPRILGASHSITTPYSTPSDDGYNVGKTGADGADMLGQAKRLVSLINSTTSTASFKLDWKVYVLRH